MPGAGTCTNAEKIVGVSVSFTTASGRPATVDGGIAVSVQSGTGTAVVTGVNTFDVVSGDVAEDVVVVVSADADLGAGVETISDTYTLTVTSEHAANFGFSGGTVAPK